MDVVVNSQTNGTRVPHRNTVPDLGEEGHDQGQTASSLRSRLEELNNIGSQRSVSVRIFVDNCERLTLKLAMHSKPDRQRLIAGVIESEEIYQAMDWHRNDSQSVPNRRGSVLIVSAVLD